MAQTGHATSRRRWLEAQVKTGEAPVYRYHFELPAPVDKFHPAGGGAFHSDDIEYVFGTLDSREGAQWRPEDRALSDLIGQYWTTSRVPAIRTVQPPAEIHPCRSGPHTMLQTAGRSCNSTLFLHPDSTLNEIVISSSIWYGGSQEVESINRF
jgi:hypothetical protein